MFGEFGILPIILYVSYMFFESDFKCSPSLASHEDIEHNEYIMHTVVGVVQRTNSSISP
jgi:hypothetical protein